MEEQNETLIEEFPGLSKYETSECCCCRCTKFPETKAKFIDEWETSWCMPSFVLILMTLSLAAYIYAVPTVWGSISYQAFVPIISILYCLWFASYVMVLKTGPGYYPFYAANNTKNPYETQENFGDLIECPYEGIITSKAQYKWTHEAEMPPRCILSKMARRIVIKPDHFCGWTATWIGKRNFKLFILFNVYGVLYNSFYIGTAWKVIYHAFKNFSNMNAAAMISFIMIILCLNFFFLTFSFSFNGLRSACINKTSWEEWNKIDVSEYNKGCCENMIDTCGDRHNKLLWLFPVAPFRNIPNGELIVGYSRYPRMRHADE